VKGGGRGAICDPIETFPWTDRKKTREISVTIDRITAKIRTGHFQNLFITESVNAWLNLLDSVALKGLICMPRVNPRYRLLCSYWLALSSPSHRLSQFLSGPAVRSAHYLIISWLTNSSALKMEAICSSELHGTATQNTILFISLLRESRIWQLICSMTSLAWLVLKTESSRDLPPAT
jgi:hypothetical protein